MSSFVAFYISFIHGMLSRIKGDFAFFRFFDFVKKNNYLLDKLLNYQTKDETKISLKTNGRQYEKNVLTTAIYKLIREQQVKSNNKLLNLIRFNRFFEMLFSFG